MYITWSSVPLSAILITSDYDSFVRAVAGQYWIRHGCVRLKSSFLLNQFMTDIWFFTEGILDSYPFVRFVLSAIQNFIYLFLIRFHHLVFFCVYFFQMSLLFFIFLFYICPGLDFLCFKRKKIFFFFLVRFLWLFSRSFLFVISHYFVWLLTIYYSPLFFFLSFFLSYF